MKWTEEEIKFLRQNYHKLKYKQIAEILGRSLKSVETKAFELGLRKGSVMPTVWTEEKIEYLKKNYHKMTYEELSKQLGISKRAIKTKLRQLGIKKRYKPELKVETKLLKLSEITCNSMNCSKRKYVGISLSGNELYYCPVYKVTIGKDARPAEKCVYAYTEQQKTETEVK